MICAAIALLVTSTPAYKVIDTGVPARYAGDLASMNNHGEVVGMVGDGEDPDSRGFYWKAGKLELIASPDGGPVMFTDINDEGTAVGSMYKDRDVDDVPFIYTRKKGFKTVDEPILEVHRISESGIVAATGFDEEGRLAVGTWRPGGEFKPVQVLEPRCVNFLGCDINDAGLLVVNAGNFFSPQSGEFLADDLSFRAAKGVAPALLSTVRTPTEGETSFSTEGFTTTVTAWYYHTYAGAINNKGWVCGGIAVPDTRKPYQTGPSGAAGPGSVTDLSASGRAQGTSFPHPWEVTGSATLWPPNNTRLQFGLGTYFHDINDSCVAVGGRSNRRGPGVPWFREAIISTSGGTLRNLNDLVPEGSPWLLNAIQINNAGEILCIGRRGEEGLHWYVLKPAK